MALSFSQKQILQILEILGQAERYAASSLGHDTLARMRRCFLQSYPLDTSQVNSTRVGSIQALTNEALFGLFLRHSRQPEPWRRT
jgi:hypothetical protein